MDASAFSSGIAESHESRVGILELEISIPIPKPTHHHEEDHRASIVVFPYTINGKSMGWINTDVLRVAIQKQQVSQWRWVLSLVWTWVHIRRPKSLHGTFQVPPVLGLKTT